MLLNHDLTSVTVEADATNIPSGFEVDVSELEVGDPIIAGDIELPEGVSWSPRPTRSIVSGLAAPTAEQLDAEIAEAEAEVPAAGRGQRGREPSRGRPRAERLRPRR